MSDVPEEVRRLARERERLRSERDFAAADTIRSRIESLGYRITDTPAGPRAEPIASNVARVRAADVERAHEGAATAEFSVHWLVEGWPEDVHRGIASFRRFAEGRSVQHVVADSSGDPADPSAWPETAEYLPLETGTGWAEARNAGLRRSTGAIVVIVDGSVEASGNVLGPLEKALADPGVGIAGPFGLVTADLREFRTSPGPEVDAIEGYLMAVRHEVLELTGGFDEQFTFYRSADLEYSFRVKDRGLRAVVVEIPVERHEHRMWANTPEEERARLSKRNFNRFLDRFRGRFDLCVEAGEGYRLRHESGSDS
ncbi:MAG: glycosyltransferase [Actinomycetota bacterium]|nr:glycosyltransferase [Actinomycetota bacterium]